MEEQPSKAAIEEEIAELSRAIEAKRASLESGGEKPESKEVVRAVLKEKIVNATVPATPVSTTISTSSDYVDLLDDVSAAKVSTLVSSTFTDGIKKTFARLVLEEPYIIDAYHDVLVDRLYDELVSRKMI